MKDKQLFRSEFSKLRKMTKSCEKDARITERLLEQDEVRDADVILMFASFGSEPDTWAVAEKLLKSGKKICFPRCRSEGGMTFHAVTDFSELTENPDSFGIREPAEDLPCPVISCDTVCIVPGLAFTENGARLGYGGGFYDRFLEKHDVHTIALAYEKCITHKLPEEQHDLRVEKIITEERTVLCN